MKQAEVNTVKKIIHNDINSIFDKFEDDTMNKLYKSFEIHEYLLVGNQNKYRRFNNGNYN